MFSLNNVSVYFKNNEGFNYILNKITYKFLSKGLVFIEGKSGCGKSTLLNVLTGLLKPNSGKVLYKNIDIYKLNNNQKKNLFKNEFGIIFQSFNLFEYLTCLENLQIAANIKGVTLNISKMPIIEKLGLKNLLNKKVYLLSGGEKQRLSLVRALINNPDTIICDEPTGQLDLDNSKIIMDYLYSLRKDKLILIVTHNHSLIDVYNDSSILEINEGKLNVIREYKNEKQYEMSSKNAKSISFSKYLVKNKLKENHNKNVFSSISLVFGFVILLLIKGISFGYQSNYLNFYKSYLDYNLISISKNEYLTNKNGLNVVKKETPTLEEISTYLVNYNYSIYCPINYLFSTTKIKSDNKKIEDCKISFFYSNISLNCCYINDLFAKKYEVNLDEKIDIEINSILKLNENNMENILNFKNTSVFPIKNINKEFGYLNEETIYLPYMYYYNLLAQNIENNNISYLDIIKSNDEYNLYHYDLLFDEQSFNKIIKDKIINSSNSNLYSFSSNHLEKITSLLNIIDSLFKSLEFISYIIITSNLCLLGFLCYASFNKSKKEFAILRVLGANDDSIIEVFIYEQLIIFGFSLAISIIISIVLKLLINKLLIRILVFDNFIIFNLKDILLIFLVIFASFFLFSYIPLKINSKQDISKILKEE